MNRTDRLGPAATAGQEAADADQSRGARGRDDADVVVADEREVIEVRVALVLSPDADVRAGAEAAGVAERGIGVVEREQGRSEGRAQEVGEGHLNMGDALRIGSEVAELDAGRGTEEVPGVGVVQAVEAEERQSATEHGDLAV